MIFIGASHLHKLLKGRKRQLLVDILGFPVAWRVEPANMSRRKAARYLVDGLKLVQRKEPGFATIELNWIVERTFAWLGRERRLSKDYEEKVQTSETMIAIAACRLLIKRLAA